VELIRTICSPTALIHSLACVALANSGFAAGTVVHVPSGVIAIESVRAGDLVLSRDLVAGTTAFRRVARTYVLANEDLILVRFHQDGPDEDSMRIDTLAAAADQPFFVKSTYGSAGTGWRGARDYLDNGDRVPLANGSDACAICADQLHATDKPGIAWCAWAWGGAQNDGGGYRVDMRFHPPVVSDDESYNWGLDGGRIETKYRADVVCLEVEDSHSFFVGTMGAWVHDATK